MLRAAAWPIETLDHFAAPHLAESADRLLAEEREILDRRELIVAALHEAVPAFDDRRARAYLLEVKRRVHQGAGMLPNPPAEIEARLAANRRVHDLLVGEEAPRSQLAEHMAAFELQHEAEIERQRLALEAATSEDRFRRALLLANPLVERKWRSPYREIRGPTKRERDLEATVFRYLMRAIGRPSPAGTWAGVAPVYPQGGKGRGLSLVLRPPRYEVTVNLASFSRILESLAGSSRYLRRAPLRLNPTLHAAPDGWRCERLTDDGATWIHLRARGTVSALIAHYLQHGSRPAQAAIEGLVASGENRAGVERALETLVDADILRVDLSLPPAAPSAWAALGSAVPSLLVEDRPRWKAEVGKIKDTCRRLGAVLGSAEPAAIAQMRSEIEHQVAAMGRWAGVSGGPAEPVVYVDMRLPLSVHWDANLVEEVERAVRELLAFHWREGGAERARRMSLQRLVGSLRPPVEINVLSGLAEGRFGQGGQAPDLEEHSSWESLVREGRDEPVLRFTDRAVDGDPWAGPWGSVLIRLGGSSGPWIGAAQPQPGLFAARHGPALRDGEDEAEEPALFGQMRDTLDRVGVLPVEVVGIDAGAPNAALRPALAEATLDPHDVPGRSLHGVSLLIDGGWRPWLLGPRGSRPLAPVYNSTATVGRRDSCSALLVGLALASGWDLAASRLPALQPERTGWSHVPRLVLPGGAVLSPRRWMLDLEALDRITSRSGANRYLAWRREVVGRGLPELVYVRQGTLQPEILMRTDSPLAIRCLFDRTGDAPWLMLTELPGRPETWPLVDEEGRHYVSELAVTWYAEGWGAEATKGLVGEGALTPGSSRL